MKIKIVLFYLLVIFKGINASAQMVESKSYNTMLKSLLSHSVKEISAKTAHKEINAIFLDARSIEEFNVSHIQNAIWCGYDDFQISSVASIQKGKKIIVYCSVGYRSEKVTEKLVAAGFSNVSNLYGGIFEWKNEGYPVYNNAGMETEKIHAYNESWGVWLNKGEKVYN